jgi:hypothetical protein
LAKIVLMMAVLKMRMVTTTGQISLPILLSKEIVNQQKPRPKGAAFVFQTLS